MTGNGGWPAVVFSALAMIAATARAEPAQGKLPIGDALRAIATTGADTGCGSAASTSKPAAAKSLGAERGKPGKQGSAQVQPCWEEPPGVGAFKRDLSAYKREYDPDRPPFRQGVISNYNKRTGSLYDEIPRTLR